MPSILLDTGVLLVTVRYVRANRKGSTLFYHRRIPEALRSHYDGREFRRVSLGTRDLAVAAPKATKLAAEDDALWATLRSSEGRKAKLTTSANREAARALLTALQLSPGVLAPKAETPEGRDPVEVFDSYFERRYGKDYLEARHDPQVPFSDLEEMWTPLEREMIRLAKEDPRKPRVLLSDALAVYLKDHDKGADPKFARDAGRAIGHVYSIVGDFPLTDYRREHANAVRDALLKGGNKTATARRRLNAIKAVFNKGLREFDLRSHGNPFERLQIAKEAQDAETREAFSKAELQVIAKACRSRDDDIRHIVALQADTGARLAEIVGLRVNDVVLDHETPHIIIRPNEALGRTLKNTNSERKVPLIGESLWAAERAMRATKGSGWLFPRYAVDGNVKATSAAQTINKWLSKTLKLGKTTHSFRHAMRDRLRHADVPEEFQNLIGGWGSRTVGQGYGAGYLLGQLHEQLEKVVSAK